MRRNHKETLQAAYGKNSMHAMVKQNIRSPVINTTRNTLVYPVKILEGERAGAGPPAKSPGKPKLLPRMPRMDPIGLTPSRTLMRKEKVRETSGNPQAHGENSMCTTAKQNIRSPVINTTRKKSIDPIKTIEVFGPAGDGPPAKSPGKPKLLPRMPRMDPIGLPPSRALMRREKAHGENSMCATAKQNINSPVINTTRKKSIETIEVFGQAGDGPAAKSPGKPQHLPRTPRMDPIGLPPSRALMRRDKLSKTSGNPQVLTGTTEVKSKSLEATIEVEPQLRTTITDAVLDCITSTLFKNQLTQRIVGEIDDILAKAVSQVHEQQHAVRFGTAGGKINNISREQQSSNNVFMLGVSDSVASVIGYALIEVREDMKKTFRSQSYKFQTASPTACDSVTEIVDSVFEGMLDSLIPQLKPDVCTERDPSMIASLHSHEFDTVSDSILPSTDSDFNQSPVHEPRGSADESRVTAQDIETFDIVKERADSPRRSTKVPFSTVFDQSSGPEVKAKDEVEGILAASGSMSHLDGPLTSRVKSDSDLDTSVLELTATSATENVDHMSRSDEVAEEGLVAKSDVELEQIMAATSATENVDHMSRFDEVAEEGLVAKSDVELEQIMAAPSEENTPSDITSQSLQLIGHQECASPVPSPPSGDKPASPRGSARRSVRPMKASSLPNIFSDKEDGIFEQSHQKLESDGKRRLSLTGMEMGSSGSRSGPDEPLTSRVKSDSDLDTSVLELTATSATENVDHMSSSDEVAEEGLVAKSDVELEQIMAAPSVENTPSDITSQSLQLIGHQECASPIPSSPSGDKPASQRGSARRRACPIKPSSLANIFSDKEDGIFDQSHQKVESDGKCRLSLTGMEMGSSDSRSGLDEPLTSRVKSAFDLDTSVLELTATSAIENVDHMSRSDEVAEEGLAAKSDVELEQIMAATSATESVDHMSRFDEVAEEGLVAKSDVELEQIMAAPSEENTPSDITSQNLQLIGQKECASPVPSPPSGDKPVSPRGSARRRARPFWQRYSLIRKMTSLTKR
ncbi:uncharacterized protein LOC108270745 isoform X2 [Ictalurus punctatus]|uniref:Uncharacterized protein LOC108270745 isoform X2 n=1 Tax=Ictalurus punctatus TaxID=7998 RepID=A0A9F7R9M1_ICTPU|nr:uncharacterized protein LOC108270745 isoform X2 [Ictalurus punctatus]